MIVSKDVSFQRIFRWSWYHMVWLSVGATFFACLYKFGILHFVIPWLPISVIGTAVAFYVGFKNNQSYDRMWEARKIWGGIVNSSRSWGMQVNTFISPLFSTQAVDDKELENWKKKLVYRHLAWLYVHRSQLLVPTSWEHIKQGGLMTKAADYFQRSQGIGLFTEEADQIDLHAFLENEEFNQSRKAANMATQLVLNQGKDLAALREKGLIDDFRHLEMSRTLTAFYELQGKNERIKKFPFPRQYANMSRYFVGIFIGLLPFSMIPELMNVGDWGFWLSIPATVLIGWVYIMMELIGDYSENPFQGMANDIPMLSLCRTIEIDLREMLGETQLPESIPSKRDVLM
ncbi:hypothetical protein LAG90_05580 [Marinilongibacter aquaticus]|uniref:bestrophin family protein n=1 Tax=Marinilongibacter aquaticus TaxID=2975157 RepID=UPI0021BDD4E9|nr:bestrophin family ion channel [Marinilongibacter aquaticus]UBM60111.1 hypothetical protein LAG90_05580 [Marinilongibacter aquaticus]